MKELKTYPGTYPQGWQPVLLHQYLLQYTQTTPDAIAIISPNYQWSYQELSDFTANYAEIINKSGLTVGDRVILELEPSPQAIALILACSLLGLVFVPLSPETPTARIEQIIATTEAKLHIKSSINKKTISPYENILLGTIKENSLQIEGKSNKKYPSRTSLVLESDLAYIIFTSGTTGNPKGIMMTHRAILAFFRALVNYCNLNTAAKVGTIAPLQFDFSLLDLGLTLGSGATLVQIPRKLSLIPPKLISYIDQQQITQLNCVPAIWQLLLHYAAPDIAKLHHLKTTLFAGESFPLSQIVKLQSLLPQIKIINCFGQSESIACSFTEVPNPLPANSKNLSIGFAHPGAEMLLLDENQQEINLPDQIGEIYLRGANLFSGYWKDPSATNAALIPNPLNPLSGEKIFRTGDLAYKGDQGELYLAGRRDLQVKIRGNRVELEEIERVLGQHPHITQAVAIALKEVDNTILTAFLVGTANISVPTTQEIRSFCREILPAYMIPDQVHYLGHLPININGKVDRQALIEALEPTFRTSKCSTKCIVRATACEEI